MPPDMIWTRLAPKPDADGATPLPRSSHGVSLVGGDRLIVYGGEHVARTPIEAAQACWAVDGLDSDRPEWRRISADGGPSDRIAHAQAAHRADRVYVFGGRAGITMQERALADLWMLDCSGGPGSETWTEVDTQGDVPEARSFHRMVCVGDALYVFGGCGATSGRLNDLHKFDIPTKTWHSLEKSSLRGRGGPNLFPIAGGTKLAAVAGFAGEETKDGDRFDLQNEKWEDAKLTDSLTDMRPRSVCVAGSFPNRGCCVIFGGEVDPSDRGHEGAGGFTNDICILNEEDGSYKFSIEPSSGGDWPGPRGWSDAASSDGGDVGKLYVFGGLAGDDTSPIRLDDLWRLDVPKCN